MNEFSFNKQQDYTQGLPLRISTGVVNGRQNENYSWYCQSNAQHLILSHRVLQEYLDEG